MQCFTVCGIVSSPRFQQCSEAAEYINKTYADMFHIIVTQEVPRDYDARKEILASSGQVLDASVDAYVLDAQGTAQTAEAFLDMLQQRTTFRLLPIDPAHPDSYERRALYSWRKYLCERGNSYCWMDVTIGDEPVGRITFELFSQVLPRTCHNFWRMCRGDIEETVSDGTVSATLSYKGTSFFRILKEAWIMGGDVTEGHKGNAGFSSYGRYFPDESFAIPHDSAGILGMCNDGEHTNASSFYITRKKLSWMNGRYVAFGRVIDGMRVADAIHAVKIKHNQSPAVPVTIADCGVLDVSM